MDKPSAFTVPPRPHECERPEGFEPSDPVLAGASASPERKPRTRNDDSRLAGRGARTGAGLAWTRERVTRASTDNGSRADRQSQTYIANRHASLPVASSSARARVA